MSLCWPMFSARFDEMPVKIVCELNVFFDRIDSSGNAKKGKKKNKEFKFTELEENESFDIRHCCFHDYVQELA